MRLVIVKYCIIFFAALSLAFANADGTALPASNHVDKSHDENTQYTLDSQGDSVIEKVVPISSIDTSEDNADDEVDVILQELPVSPATTDALHEEPPEATAPAPSRDEFTDTTKEREVSDLADATADNNNGEVQNMLGGGLDLEGLLDQLDAATSEVQALKDERSALSAALTEKESAKQLLVDQLVSLRDQLTAMDATITELRAKVEACHSNVNTSLESSKEEVQAYQAEKLTLLDKIAAAERNASSLAIKAKLERNERTIARLSLENCQLELGGVRSGQLDEIAELKAELAAVKRTREVKCKPCSVSKQGQSQGPASGECDTSACINSFVSKYLFFWAEEHQAQDTTTKTSIASTVVAPTSPTSQPKPEVHTPPRSQHNVDGHRNLQYEEILSYMQYGTEAAQVGLRWLIAQYFTYLHPVLYRVIAWEIDIVCTIAGMCVKGATGLWEGYLSPLWFNTALPALQDLYTHQIVPLYMQHGHPLYQTYIEGAVKAAYTYYQINEDWIGHNIEDPVEYIIGRLHYAFYFTALFFSPREIGRNMQGVWYYLQGFVPAVIAQLSSMPPIQAQLGEQCETVVTIGVYLTVALFLYLCRRFIFGVVALLAMLVLSPVLLAVYAVAKLAALFKPRKKSAKRGAERGAAGNGGASTGAGSGKPAGKLPAAGLNNGSGGNLVSASTPSAAQLATRNFPMNAPVINPAPGYIAPTQRDARSHQPGDDPRQAVSRRPRGDGPPVGASHPTSHGSSGSSGNSGAPLSRPPLVSRSASASSQPPPTHAYSRTAHSDEAVLGV